MKIYCSSSETKLPAIPKNRVSTNFNFKTIERRGKDGDIYTFDILTSKASAIGFIMSKLGESSFPLITQFLDDYRTNPEYYREKMMQWEDEPIDSDQALDVYADYKWYSLDIDSSLTDAIALFKNAKSVQQLIYRDGYNIFVYNGYIMFDERNDCWFADFDIPYRVKFEDCEWEEIHGTNIEKPQSDIA